MKSSSSNPLKILDQSFISPPPSPSGDSPPSLPLTFFDLLWLNYGPVERLFFFNYPHSTSHFLHSHLPILKSSLSAALSSFYPFAASLRQNSQNHFEISPSLSDSVPLTTSEYPGEPSDFLHLSSDLPRPVENLLPLVPQLPNSKLLAAQITLFPNHGLCLALTVHHSTCDGFSSMQFVNSWARFAPPPNPMLMDRSAIPDPRNLRSQMERALLDTKAKETIQLMGAGEGVFAETFRLSTAEIDWIKEAAKKKAEEKGVGSFHCSSFVTSLAYSWICLLRTRRVADEEGKAHLIFAVDWRRRSGAGIPANYFGNCVSGCFVRGDAARILSEDGILEGCLAIGKGIEELGEDPGESMDGVLERLAEVAPWRPLSVAGSPGMGVYGVDFGWGRPRKVEVVSTRETGALAMAEGRDGGGGVEIGVILPEDELKVFGEYFAAGMDWS